MSSDVRVVKYICAPELENEGGRVKLLDFVHPDEITNVSHMKRVHPRVVISRDKSIDFFSLL